jgi:hypothetical protein
MSEFIRVSKNGEIIEVHPDALKDHERLGWTVVIEEKESVSAETPTESKKETRKNSSKA